MYAIKVININPEEISSINIKLARREVEILKKLNHKYIIKLNNVFEKDH